MILGHGEQVAAALRDEGDADRCPFGERPALATDVPRQERESGTDPAHVELVMRVTSRIDVIAEPLRLLVGVRVAADPRQQTRLVHDTSIHIAQPQPFTQPQRDQAGTDHVLHRLTEPEIGSQRQERHQLSATDARATACVRLLARHAASVPHREATHTRPDTEDSQATRCTPG